ncbi:MAG TPA: hypothetical protein VIV60_04950 [Polyangiaceae bacterium]
MVALVGAAVAACPSACGGRIAEDASISPDKSSAEGGSGDGSTEGAELAQGGTSETGDKKPTRIAAGDSFTCASGTSAIECWGLNSDGQLGSGSAVNCDVPAIVSHPIQRPKRLVAGCNHTCALVSDVVSCWGNNKYGQLGVDWNLLKSSSVPATPVALSGPASDIAIGTYHSCAVVRGDVYCWGGNVFKQLGASTMGDTWLPVVVKGMPSIVSEIAANTNLTCALASGSVYCWGDNSEGQLGDAVVGQPETAIRIQGLALSATAVAVAREHACALLHDGTLACWGKNDRGQLGNGSFEASRRPVTVKGGYSNVSAVSCGHSHCCLIASGKVACWGAGASGELGGSFTDSATPRAVNFSTGYQATHVSAGGNHSCAIVGQELYCWGGNESGQLGNRTTTDSATPVLVSL